MFPVYAKVVQLENSTMARKNDRQELQVVGPKY
jgi:hypothetical protein